MMKAPEFFLALILLLASDAAVAAPQTWSPPKPETAQEAAERQKVQQSIPGEGAKIPNWKGPGDLVPFLARLNSQAATNTAPQPADIAIVSPPAPKPTLDEYIAAAPCRAGEKYQSSTLINPGLEPGNVSQLIRFGHIHRGNATNYGYDHMTGACAMQYMAEGVRFLGVAVGIMEWYGGLTCGACVEIDPGGVGSDGTKTIAQVTNACPECRDGLDLEDQTFIAMTGHQGGREPIQWKFIPCPPFKTNIEFWTGGNQYDFKIVPRNMAGAVVRLEAQSAAQTSTWTNLIKMNTMHWSVKGEDFAAERALGLSGYVNLRLTGIDGQQIIQQNVSMLTDRWQMGNVQFSQMSPQATTSCKGKLVDPSDADAGSNATTASPNATTTGTTPATTGNNNASEAGRHETSQSHVRCRRDLTQAPSLHRLSQKS